MRCEDLKVKIFADLKVKIFADGADINDMLKVYKKGMVKGFTTNQSLMKQAGIKGCKGFAQNKF